MGIQPDGPLLELIAGTMLVITVCGVGLLSLPWRAPEAAAAEASVAAVVAWVRSVARAAARPAEPPLPGRTAVARARS